MFEEEKAVTKTDVLVYGMIVEADIFENDHWTSRKDEQLLHQALFKLYGATEEMTEEELQKLDAILENDKKKLAEEYRAKIVKFLESNV